MKTAIKKRSIKVGDRKTSVSLENEIWSGLKDIAQEKRITLPTLVNSIKAQGRQNNLSSTIRLFVFEHFRVRLHM